MEQTVLQKWEYFVEEMNGVDSLCTSLTRLGGEGWELVNVLRGSSMEPSAPVKSLRVRKGDNYCAIFKRPCC